MTSDDVTDVTPLDDNRLQNRPNAGLDTCTRVRRSLLRRGVFDQAGLLQATSPDTCLLLALLKPLVGGTGGNIKDR